MEKTIEAIWQEGFLDDKALLAPKLNDLYNQKSSNLVDKMTRMFKINLRALAAFAIVALIACVAVGLPYVGATLFTLFALLVVVGKRDLRSLEAIDKGVSSYEYIKAFDNWLKGNIARFSMIYRFFYPVLFVGIVLGLWFSHPGEKMLKTVIEIRPEIYLVDGVPVYWALAAVACTGIIALTAPVLYRFDMKLVYGNVMKKLDEILTDMEELRN